MNRPQPKGQGRIAIAKRLLLALLCIPALFHIPAVFAQAYPSKPVTIIVPFAAGGGTDLLARFWGAILQKELGQSFIIDVRAGTDEEIEHEHPHGAGGHDHDGDDEDDGPGGSHVH